MLAVGASHVDDRHRRLDLSSRAADLPSIEPSQEVYVGNRRLRSATASSPQPVRTGSNPFSDSASLTRRPCKGCRRRRGATHLLAETCKPAAKLFATAGGDSAKATPQEITPEAKSASFYLLMLLGLSQGNTFVTSALGQDPAAALSLPALLEQRVRPKHSGSKFRRRCSPAPTW